MMTEPQRYLGVGRLKSEGSAVSFDYNPRGDAECRIAQAICRARKHKRISKKDFDMARDAVDVMFQLGWKPPPDTEDVLAKLYD